jgi:tetratricopeptide (TPR) repeat protein
VLREGLAQSPTNQSLLFDFARVAQTRGDSAEAASRWERARHLVSEHIDPYVHGALNLRRVRKFREAERMLIEARERFPDHPMPMKELGWMAQEEGDWKRAAEQWTLLRQVYPSELDGYTQGIVALRRLGRRDEAGSVAADGAKRFPNSAELACARAWIAFDNHDWDLAEHYFAAVRNGFPREPAGYLGGARLAVDTLDYSKADFILREGINNLPNNRSIWLEYAKIPAAGPRPGQENLEECWRRFANLRARYPDFELAYNAEVSIRTAHGSLGDAERIALEAIDLFPHSPRTALDLARVAEKQRNWDLMYRRYSAVASRYPEIAEAHCGIAEALVQTGKLEQADELVAKALTSMPESVELTMKYADVATARRAWDEALQRWRAAYEKFPLHPDVRRGLYAAQTMAEADHDQESRSSAIDGDLAGRDLLTRFESLGGTFQGCEFGLVQRALGAEPLGLLRWSNIGPQELALALQSGFEGVGTPENTELRIMDHTREYFTADRQYGMVMHTFTYANQVPFEDMYKRCLSRLLYLRDKLIRDLKDDQKIFVYRIPDRNLSEEELNSLYAAMRRYGNNALLNVRYPEGAFKPGDVVLARPGLMLGHIAAFSVSRSGRVGALPVNDWLQVCRNAWAVWSKERAAETFSHEQLVT